MIRKLLLAGLVCFVLVLGAVFAMLSTERGLAFVARIALSFAGDSVTISQIEGRLVGPIELRGVAWSVAGSRGSIDRIAFDWQPADLLARRLNLEYLHVAGVTAELLPAEPSASDAPPTWPESIDIPVAVNIDRVLITQVRVRPSPAGDAIAIDQIAMQISGDTTRLALDALDVQAPLFGATGSGHLTTGRDYTANAAVDWWAELVDLPRTVGHTSIDVRRNSISLQQGLAEPVAASLTGSAEFTDSLLSWQAQLMAENVDPSTIRADWPALIASANLSLTGSADDVAISGTLDLPAWLPAQAAVDIALTRGAGNIVVDSGTIALKNRAEAVTVSGNVALDYDAEASDVQLTWRSLAWPLTPVDTANSMSSEQGTLRLQGTPARFTFSGKAGLAGSTIPATQLEVSGHGDLNAIDIDKLNAALLDGHIEGSGRLTLGKTLVANLELAGRQLDPGLQWPGWDGRVAFDMGARASISEAVTTFKVQASRLDGNLRGHDWTGDADVVFDGARWSVNALRLTGPPASLQISGSAGDLLDLHWNIDASDMAALHPDAAGSLRTQGSVTGTRTAPVVQASLSGAEFRWTDTLAEQIELTARLDVTNRQASAIDLTIGRLKTAGRDARDVVVEARGLASQHVLSARATVDGNPIDTQIAGGWSDSQWQGDIAALNIVTTRTGTWTLASPTALRLSASAASLGSLCLVATDQSACAEGKWSSSQGWSASARITDLDLAQLAILIPGQPALTGRVSANGSVSGTGAMPVTGEASAALRDGALRESDSDDDEFLIDNATGSWSATLSGGRLDSLASVDLGQRGTIQMTLGMPLTGDTSPGTAPISGTLTADTRTLMLVPLVTSDVDRVRGRLLADLTVGGTLQSPELTGNLELSDAQADVPELGVQLKRVNATLHAQAQSITLDGSFDSGDGSGKLTGRFDFGGEAPSGKLQLSGTNLTIIDLPEVHIEATPDVDVAITGRTVALTGTVLVPSARITPIDLAEAVRVSPDQEIVGAEVAEARSSDLAITTEVELVMGDDVSVDAYGLKGTLGGRLRVFDYPDRITTGTGEVEVTDGTYKAYGQQLDITRGRLIFSGGAISNPALDITAVRESKGVKAGVNIRGVLNAPQLVLFSEPTLPQSEIFSYLLVGQPLTSLNESDRQLVDSASNSLALRGGALLARQLGRQLGLDDVQLEGSDNPDEARVVVGTYLSPRLYVSYGIGLFDAVNALRIRYQLNKYWSIAAESGLISGADVEYTVDR